MSSVIAWGTHTFEKHRLNTLHVAVTQRRQVKHIRRAFAAWENWVYVHTRVLQSHTVSVGLARWERVELRVAHLMRILLKAGWKSWRMTLNTSSRERKIVYKRTVCVMQSYWCMWTMHWDESKRRKRVLDKIAWRMRNLHMGRSWTTWEWNVREVRRQGLVLDKMSMRMRKGCMYKAWSAWRHNACELRTQAAVGGRVVLRWKNQSMSKMFVAWKGQYMELSWLRRVAAKVLR